MRKIYIQLSYGENDYHWLISDRKKRFGGVLVDNEYHNHLCEDIARNVGYEVVNGTLEVASKVNDLNTHIRYETYTLLVK